MRRLRRRSTRTDTRVPDTTLFRSHHLGGLRVAAWLRPGAPVRTQGSREPLQAACVVVRSLVILLSDIITECGRSGRAEGVSSPQPVLRLSEEGDQRREEAHSGDKARHRSEEHTSELQSLMRISYAVFCLKKK